MDINGCKVKFDISGQKYHRLTAIKPIRTKSRDVKWLFRCDCGNEILIRSTSAKNGNTKSCGCLKLTSKKTHGLSNTRFYRQWQSMHQRVKGNIKNSKHYTKLKIEKDWYSFESFYKDMYPSYKKLNAEKKRLSLERWDNRNGYVRGNCTWANEHMQSRNRSISGYANNKDQLGLF